MLADKMPDKVKKIIEDIQAIKIQGATNVALAVFKAMKIWLREYVVLNATDKNTGKFSKRMFIADVEKMGSILAWARPNEPLAKNGVKFVTYNLHVRFSGVHDFEKLKDGVLSLMDEYVELIKSSKKKIAKNAIPLLKDKRIILTHCHSSTAEKALIGVNKARNNDFMVVATETRPLYQGRITATNLNKAGVDVTMIVDSAVASFIVDDRYMPVEGIIIGVDQINTNGSAVNKGGSLAIALASYMGSKDVYVLGPLLKLDLTTIYNPIKVELREANEVWKEAPDGVHIINPAFEIVPAEFITGYITEFGLVKPSDVEKMLVENYEWIV